MKRLTWLLLLAACGGQTTATTLGPAAAIDAPPTQVADEVVRALADGDPLSIARLTDLRPMAWLAMVEGATVEEAAGIEEEDEAIAVASNFWTGFLESATLDESELDHVDAFTEGDTNFARIELPAGSIVLSQGEAWRIDVIASFGAPLAERLLAAAEVVIANESPEADRLRQMLLGERDAVAVAVADSSITAPARAAVEEVLAAIDNIDR
jgi:hypothetical protein